MSDPLSVAGSAVGIISLGIQVCQGMISYLQSFKGQDQDIQDSLNYVQTVISILYSLKGILPKVDKSSSETPAIRRCLAESEEKLREFQQFSLKLRGTQSPEHDVLGKMNHARRALLYPFREGKLKSLCQSLKGLLQNLSLCLDITTLDIAVGIHTNVDDLVNAMKGQVANVAKLSDQLQFLDNSMAVYYQDLRSELSQAQLFAQDFRQEIGGQLRLISTDVGSLMSINRRHQEDMNQRLVEAFDELKEQNDFQNELIRTTLDYVKGYGSNEISSRFAEAERAILSLYRDRESSPYDQDENGKSHAMLALETTLHAIGMPLLKDITQLTRESLSLSAMGLIKTLASTAGGENGKIFVGIYGLYFELHPIFQAIFQESINMLEKTIAKSPEAVTESMNQVTTVMLYIRDIGSSDSRLVGWCMEVIRFLTFEALEMTHTCCEFTILDRPDISSENFDALINCDPGRWQKIRNDKREQENAALLETLMQEFIAYMIGMESSPRSLEIFVNGYWRQRISEIYAVDLNEIKDMDSCLVGTQTYVLPDRVRPFLREDFKLIELQDLKSELTPVGETSCDEKVELGNKSLEILPCKLCG
ncbi:hypothetical protein FMUND_3496 [Fusarium mundagurra]|uniref:Fungal N-terminal domain-containing protein n=1 Tax=Fusarium mundagurra TaxID=1567541 RepID=A0A8H6DLC4_9HYPO|nr:hypothetical protein FMUND_3496 [Fusarium mundagurra]